MEIEREKTKKKWKTLKSEPEFEWRVSFQQNVGLDAVHTGVITKSLIPEILGKSVFTAPIPKDEEVKFRWDNIDLALPENADWTKFRIAAILWATDSQGVTRFFNGRVLNASSALGTSNQDLSEIDEIKVYLNSNRDKLYVESNDDIHAIKQTYVFNSVGASINHRMNTNGQKNSFLDFSRPLSSGVYYLKVVSLHGEKTYSFVAYW